MTERASRDGHETHRLGREQARRMAVTLAVTTACAVLLLTAAACGPVKKSGSPGAEGETTTATDTTTTRTTEPTTPLPLAGKVLPPEKGAYLGVFVPPAPFDAAQIDTYQELTGRGVSIVMWYQPWANRTQNAFDSAACVTVMRRGKVPMITWEPWDPALDPGKQLRNPNNQPSYRLSAIINGKHDKYIREWARAIRQVGGPIMLRPLHEMNGNWYPWSGTVNGNKPTEFREAWRHIHDVFTQEGATNVTWVWSINHESVPNAPGNKYADYYPGDRYVDWTAISGFNTGATQPKGKKPGKWRSWAYRYERPLAFLKSVGKPICLSEMGTVEQGGSKAQWLIDAYQQIPRYPLVDAVIYYDANESLPNVSRDWRIATSKSSVAGMREAVASPYYLSTPPPVLSTWVDSLSEADLRQLSEFRPIY